MTKKNIKNKSNIKKKNEEFQIEERPIFYMMPEELTFEYSKEIFKNAKERFIDKHYGF